MHKSRLLIFASGGKAENEGGSGFKNLVEHTYNDRLKAHIVGVVSNHPNGGVYHKARELNVPFIHFAGPYDPFFYRDIVELMRPDFVALSGWLKPVRGLKPERTFNIHPGPLPEFGGKNMYGHHVHEAVIKARHTTGQTHSEVCVHFVTEKYDEGPVIFRMPVLIIDGDTPTSLAERVLAVEHEWQPIIANHILNGIIHWNGVVEDEPVFPLGYKWHQRNGASAHH